MPSCARACATLHSQTSPSLGRLSTEPAGQCGWSVMPSSHMCSEVCLLNHPSMHVVHTPSLSAARPVSSSPYHLFAECLSFGRNKLIGPQQGENMFIARYVPGWYANVEYPGEALRPTFWERPVKYKFNRFMIL